MKVIEMIKKCFRNNESGFSLAELMVAAGIVGIISLALTRIMTQATQTQKKVTTDMTINETYLHIRNILRNEDNCNMAFGERKHFYTAGQGKPYAVNIEPRSVKYDSSLSAPLIAIVQYSKLNDIPEADGSKLSTIYNYVAAQYEKGIEIGKGTGGSAWLSGMKVNKISPLNGTQGELNLQIIFNRINPNLTAAQQEARSKNSYGAREIVKDIKIKVDVAGGKIVKCNADLSDYQEQFCETALQGKWNGMTCESITIDDVNNEPSITAAASGSGAGLKATAGSGNAIEATGSVAVNTGNVQVTTGNVQVTTGNVQVTTGNVQVATGSVLVNTGNVDVTNGDIFLHGGGGDLLIYNTSNGVEALTDQDKLVFANVGKRVGLVTAASITSGAPTYRNSMQINENDMTFSDNIIINGNTIINGNGRVNVVPPTTYPIAPANDTFIPNVKWVDNYLRNGLAAITTGADVASGQNIIADMLSRIAGYASNRPMDAVALSVCGKMRINNISGTASGRTGCTFSTPDTDTKCNTSGSCSSVCIGSVCRSSWPPADGVCSTYNQCSQVCVRTTCRTNWPKLVFGGINTGGCAWKYIYHPNSSNRHAYCPGQGVVRGFYFDGGTSAILCCRHRTENGTAGNNQWSTY